jgi:1-acyl-sn-glycerol-3-phosphate acyltransferase
MILLRLSRIVLHLFSGLWICALVFPRTDHAGRQLRIQHWSIKLLAICGVRLQIRHVSPAQAPQQALIVANHVSWLDMFVINAVEPCRFVAKSDIRDWPLLGWLCDRAGTIFIARGKQRDVRRIYQGLITSLRNGERIAFFPEGTTVAQGALLPFHSNLFEAAIDGVPVRPYALRYLDDDGKPHGAIDFIGDMTFVQSMFAILKAGRITAVLISLPLIESGNADRRQLAQAARNAIAAALGHAEMSEQPK